MMRWQQIGLVSFDIDFSNGVNLCFLALNAIGHTLSYIHTLTYAADTPKKTVQFIESGQAFD